MQGYLKSGFDIKLLSLYVLSFVDKPVTFEELAPIVLVDEGVNYFSLKQCIEELAELNNLSVTEKGYVITPRGLKNLHDCENSLPPESLLSVCQQGLHSLKEEWNKRDYGKCSIMEQQDGTFQVQIELVNDGATLLELQFLLGNSNEAKAIATGFQKNPLLFYNEMMDKLKSLGDSNYPVQE